MKPEVLRKRRASSQSCLEKPFTNLQPQGNVRLGGSTPLGGAEQHAEHMTHYTGLDCLPAMAASMPAPVTQQMAPSRCHNKQRCLLALNWLGTTQCAEALSVHQTRPGLMPTSLGHAGQGDLADTSHGLCDSR